MEPQPVVMDSAAGTSPKGKKRRKFWRLRRQKETDRDANNEDTRSASDGRISPQDEEDVAELLANPWLVSRQLDRLSPAVQEEDEETSKSSGYKVTVTILSGHGLAVRDRTGTSDPYVKMRYGLSKYRTAVVSRCLNPVWNEVYSFPAHDLSIPIQLKVYDHDFASSDDFMGEGSLDLNAYKPDMVHTVELGLTDGNSHEDLGYIRLLVELRDLLDEELEEGEAESVEVSKVKRSGSQQWLSTVTITLLGAKSLPAMDDNGLSDPYCKFKLGNQKYKSKVQPKTLDPEWKERFEMKLYDSGSTTLHLEVWDRDFPASDDYIGCCKVELKDFEPDRTHDLCLPLEDNTGSVQLLLAITGIESHVQCVVGGATAWSDTSSKYGLMRSYKTLSLRDLGALQVKVCKAESLIPTKGHSNPYVMVEVENAQVRTQTLYRETEPVWDKTFLFNVRDIHSTITVSVFSEGKSKDELIGKLIIPLLRVVPGAVKRYALKDKTCMSRSVGTITLSCDIVYNPFKAAIRTINPRETHVLEADQKLKRKLLLQNIRRCTDVVRTVMAWWQFIQSLWSWQSKPRSTFAFIVFILLCLFADLWMFPVAAIIMFVISYFVWGKALTASNQYSSGALTTRGSLDSIENVSDFSDMEEGIEDSSSNKERKQSLRKRWRQLQDVLLTLQWATGYVADLSERLKNFFCWSVPFLCWLAVAGLTVAAVVLYFIPLRYIILLWGINKFTKRLRNPHHIPNQEILDFLSRAPTDIEQLQWKELHIRSSSNIKKVNGRSGKKR